MSITGDLLLVRSWIYDGPVDVCVGENRYIERYIVDDHEAETMNKSIKEHTTLPLPSITPGLYARMLHDGQVVQTDLPPTIFLTAGFCKQAYGDVLVTGLGLGLMNRMLLSNPRVTSVTFVENNPDIIAFHRTHSEIGAVRADAWAFPTTQPRYDCAFHDIAGELHSPDYKRQMEFLLDIWHPFVEGLHAVWGGESIGLPGGAWDLAAMP